MEENRTGHEKLERKRAIIFKVKYIFGMVFMFFFSNMVELGTFVM